MLTSTRDDVAVERVTTSVAGLDLVHRARGEGPAVVVLHHSFGTFGWPQLAAELASDHQVLVPDIPGYGDSAQPTWARHPRDLAALLQAWIDRLGLDAPVVVGAGFGGWVGAELATMVGPRLGGLVLVGAAGLVPHDGRIFDQMLVAHRQYVRQAFSDGAVYDALFGEEPSDDLLITWDLNREMTARVAWKPYMYNRALEPLLTEVRVPALVVWGDDDQIVPRECGERYVERLPDARLEIVGDCGHAVDLERPADLAALVRSLADPTEGG